MAFFRKQNTGMIPIPVRAIGQKLDLGGSSLIFKYMMDQGPNILWISKQISRSEKPFFSNWRTTFLQSLAPSDSKNSMDQSVSSPSMSLSDLKISRALCWLSIGIIYILQIFVSNFGQQLDILLDIEEDPTMYRRQVDTFFLMNFRIFLPLNLLTTFGKSILVFIYFCCIRCESNLFYTYNINDCNNDQSVPHLRGELIYPKQFLFINNYKRMSSSQYSYASSSRQSQSQLQAQPSYNTQVVQAQGYRSQDKLPQKAKTQQQVPTNQLQVPGRYQYNNQDDRPQSQITQVSGSGKPSVIRAEKPPSFLRTYDETPNYLDFPKKEKKKEEAHYKINFDPSEYNEKIVELISDNQDLKTELITKEVKINDTKENINRLREIINHMKTSGVK